MRTNSIRHQRFRATYTHHEKKTSSTFFLLYFVHWYLSKSERARDRARAIQTCTHIYIQQRLYISFCNQFIYSIFLFDNNNNNIHLQLSNSTINRKNIEFHSSVISQCVERHTKITRNQNNKRRKTIKEENQ